MDYRTCHLRESVTTPSRACGPRLDPIGESAAFRCAGSTSAARDKEVGSGRLGLMLGAGGMAIAVMVLIAILGGTQ